MGEREGLSASLVQREVARRDGAPAKAQRKRVWWGEEVRRRERDLPRLSGARRGIHSPHRRDGGIDRFTSQSQACQPGFAPQGDFLNGQKVTKDPPKAGPSPALWNPPRRYWLECAPFFFWPLARWGHIDGLPFYRLHPLLCWCLLLPPGPYPGVQLFPVAAGPALGGGNAASPG